MAAVQGNLQGPKVLEILEQAEKITKPDLFATPFIRAALIQGERKQLAKECDSDVLAYCWKREKHKGSANLLRNSTKASVLALGMNIGPWTLLSVQCSSSDVCQNECSIVCLFRANNVRLHIMTLLCLACSWLLCPKSFCFYLAGEGRKMLETLLYLVRHDSSFKC